MTIAIARRSAEDVGLADTKLLVAEFPISSTSLFDTAGGIAKVPLPLHNLSIGSTTLHVTARLAAIGVDIVGRCFATVVRAPHISVPPQRVIITGRSIMAAGLPFLPYGFFMNGIIDAAASVANVSPPAFQALGSQADVATVEAPYSFNFVAPYNAGPPMAGGFGPSRVAFLDRAAAVGMRVAYSLCGSERWPRDVLAKEIALVRDHPGLLSFCEYAQSPPLTYHKVLKPKCSILCESWIYPLFLRYL
eukprot:SAG31_NODE_895_length_11169_cov_3.114182_6_plen_248_part_00